MRNSKGYGKRAEALKCKPLFQGVGFLKFSFCQSDWMIKIVDTEVEAEVGKAERVISRSYRQSGDSYRKTERLSEAASGVSYSSNSFGSCPNCCLGGK